MQGFQRNTGIFNFKKLEWFLSLCVFLLIGQCLSALDFSKYIHISSDLGLPGSTIRCLAEDKDGVVWMGIEGVGLCKYDGHDFTLFEHDPSDPKSLSNNNVESLLIDSQGRIWVGTLYGLNLLDRKTNEFEHFFQDEAVTTNIVGDLVYDIIEDRDGVIWFGTVTGLCFLDETKNEFVEVVCHTNEGLVITPRVYDIFMDSFGFLWVSSKDGLFKLEPGNHSCLQIGPFLLEDPKLIPTEFYALTQDLQGRYWLGSDTGVLFMDEELGVLTPFDLTFGKGDPRDADVSCLLTDSRGYIWAGTYSDGLRIINPVTLEIIERHDDPRYSLGLPSNNIRDLMEDKHGMVWVAVKHAGLAVFDPRQEVFKHIRGSVYADKGLKGKHIFSLAGDDENLWIGTLHSGAFLYDPKKESYIQYEMDPEDPHSILNNRVEGIYVEDSNKVWFCTGDGLSLLYRDRNVFENFPFGICRDIIPAGDNRYWVATISGIMVLDMNTKRLEDFPIIDGIDLSMNSNLDIRKLYLDKEGTLWISSNIRGLWTYRPEEGSLSKFELDSTEGETAPDIRTPRTFIEDSKGRFWIGTRLSGLILLDRETGEWKNYTAKWGMPTDTYFGILEDRFGNLWLSSNQGVIHFNPESESVTVYDTAYGLQGDIFENHCVAPMDNGWFFFGGANGLNAFVPEKVRRIRYDSDLVFSEIKINGNGLYRDSDEALELVLPHNENFIDFSFALLDFSFPGKNEYEYRMTGLDETWVNSGNRNYASYPALPPGNYVFEVRGRNPNENLISDSASFLLTITPPFWATPTFRVSVALGIVALLVGFYFYAIYRERIQKRRLEALVTVRTSELKSANSQLQTQTLELKSNGEKIEVQNDQLTKHKFYLEDLVHERTHELEIAKDKAEESDRLKSEFIANMSHEIRTPLNAIMGFSSIIASEVVGDERINEWANRISDSSEMLASLLNDIIDFSVMESGKLQIEMVSLDAVKFFDDCNVEFKSIVEAKAPSSVSYYVDNRLIEGDDYRINSNILRLQQILINFLSNACKFTAKGSIQLGIKLSEDGQSIVYFIKDTGLGIAPQDHEIIFDRFHKVIDKSTSFYQGAGLGLSICKGLADHLGCEIWVESEFGMGSSFFLSVPLLNRNVFEGIQKVVTIKDQSISNELLVDWSEKTILVAEDAESNFEIIRKFLEPTGVTLIRAVNGVEAVKLFKELNPNPDLLLLDIKMPKMPGNEALKRIRQLAPEIPAIAQTAHALPSEQEEIVKAGFQFCITKPFARQQLTDAIARHLN